MDPHVDVPHGSPHLSLVSAVVLVVEDHPLIAIDAEDMLRSLGVADVLLAASSLLALELLTGATPTAAILDIDLGNDNSLAIAEALLARGIPFIFATGYSDGAGVVIPEHLRAIHIVDKPYSADTLAAALGKAFAPA
ncbi:MAG: response regulator [Hyphomicrobiaceae bacterium]|nr:response regulator [Hyphomicrobiaceae bacterium]